MKEKKVKGEVDQFLKKKLEKALKDNDESGIEIIQTIRKIVKGEAKKLRKVNPYNVFMKKCMLQGEKTSGKKESKEKFQKCTVKWNEMPEKDREKFKRKKLTVYDYS